MILKLEGTKWNGSGSNTLDHPQPQNFVVQYIDDTLLRWNEENLLIEAKIEALNVFFAVESQNTTEFEILMLTWLHDLMRLFWMAVHKHLSSTLFIESYV